MIVNRAKDFVCHPRPVTCPECGRLSRTATRDHVCVRCHAGDPCRACGRPTPHPSGECWACRKALAEVMAGAKVMPVPPPKSAPRPAAVEVGWHAPARPAPAPPRTDPPCPFAPGTLERLLAYQARAAAGLSVFHPGDARPKDSDRFDGTPLRQGDDRGTGHRPGRRPSTSVLGLAPAPGRATFAVGFDADSDTDTDFEEAA